jgi:4-amino-4-deoxy-L-arabinose transferase-like glycosyltransferase
MSQPAGPQDRPSGEPAVASPFPLLLILLVALGARAVFLAEFPQVQADEGLWTTSTKNFLLFDDWFMDGRNHLFLSPVFHFLSLGVFALLGPSIEAARVVSVLAGVGSVALIYLLGMRLLGDRTVALLAAAFMALDPWAVIHSRQAMTESVLLFFILGAAVLLLGRSRRELVLAGAVFSLAILTKLNAAAMGLALGGYLLLRSPAGGSTPAWRRRLEDGALFGGAALGLAALGYWAVAQVDPERFVEVFQRELGGEHVGAGEASTGRLGLRPVLAGSTLLELLRLNPFLFTYAALGGIVAWASKARGRLLLGLWLVVGFAFPLLQIYQPIRYFFPVVPALLLLVAFLVAGMSRAVSPGAGQDSRSRWAVLGGAAALVLAFNVAYLGMSLLANRGSAPRAVEAWVRENTSPDEAILAAAYLATNPPNRVYAHDVVRLFPGGLEEAVDELEIRYIIWDAAEWDQAARELLEERYTRLQAWEFGAVYGVRGAGGAP